MKSNSKSETEKKTKESKTKAENPTKEIKAKTAKKTTRKTATKEKTEKLAKKVSEKTERLKNEILKLLPAKQSDIWKTLHIDKKVCSKIVCSLAKDGLVIKTKSGGTFMIEPRGKQIQIQKPGKTSISRFSPLVSGTGAFSPCTGCQIECIPEACGELTVWITGDKQKSKTN